MITRWELNPIVLQHLRHYFHAATHIIQELAESLSSSSSWWIPMFGNFLWARSPYVTDTPSQEEAMALLGAILGTVGDQLPHEEDPHRIPLRLLAQLEKDCFARFDLLLETLLQKLEEEGLEEASPARVNAFIWQNLFPNLPYEVSQQELEDLLRTRLQACLS